MLRAPATVAVVLATLVACGAPPASSDPVPPAPDAPIPAIGTGAFGVVGHKLYLPQRDKNDAGHAIVAVVDVGVAGNGVDGAPALIHDVDLGGPELATTTAGDEDLVIAAGTDTSRVWFIDPRTDTVKKTIDLDPSWGKSSFSGGGGVVTGIAFDRAHRRAILGIYKGFAIVDLDRLAVSRVIEAAPSENFALDPRTQRLFAPFYECAQSRDANGTPIGFCDRYKAKTGETITDGLNVIDLTDDTVYTFQDPAAPNPWEPLGATPDSAAVDPNAGLVVVPSEEDHQQSVIDFTKATFDKGARTVTAPVTRVPNLRHEGVAIEATTHLAFLEEEAAGDIAVFDVAAAARGAADVVTATMPDAPHGRSWVNMSDPHGIAATSGLLGGRAVGFLVSNDRNWVARVDLAKLVAMGKDAALDASPAITMLDARTAPR